MEKWTNIERVNNKKELNEYLASLSPDIHRPPKLKVKRNKPLFLSVIFFEHSRRLVFSDEPGKLEAVRDRFLIWSSI